MWKNVVDIVLIDFVTTSTSSSRSIFLKENKIFKIYKAMIYFVHVEATL